MISSKLSLMSSTWLGPGSSHLYVGIFKVLRVSEGVATLSYQSLTSTGSGSMKSECLNLGTSGTWTWCSGILTGEPCERFILSKWMVFNSSVQIWLASLGRLSRHSSFFELYDEALVVLSMSQRLKDLMIESLIYKVSLGFELDLKLSWSFFLLDVLIARDIVFICDTVFFLLILSVGLSRITSWSLGLWFLDSKPEGGLLMVKLICLWATCFLRLSIQVSFFLIVCVGVILCKMLGFPIHLQEGLCFKGMDSDVSSRAPYVKVLWWQTSLVFRGLRALNS